MECGKEVSCKSVGLTLKIRSGSSTRPHLRAYHQLQQRSDRQSLESHQD